MADPRDSQSVDQEQPFVAHLLELRNRILRMLAVVVALGLGLLVFANDLYLFVARPLMSVLPEGSTMSNIHPMGGFMAPLKLTLILAVFLSMPYTLYQFWAFVAPGLYRHEQRLVVPLLVSSTLLFYLGMAFAYFVVFPLMFQFFVATTPVGVAVMTDISQYLDFVLTLFFAFGVAFEVPVATVLLVWMGVTTPEALVEKRPYIIVGAFVIGMFLTPPDVISQTLLAVPMWLLFEAGVMAARMLLREREAREQAEQEGGDGAARTEAPTAEIRVGEEIDSASIREPGRFVPLTPEEMDQELDAIEAEERRASLSAPEPDPVAAKLRRVAQLRDQEDLNEARRLLYEVLQEGDESQRAAARNMLQQLDDTLAG